MSLAFLEALSMALRLTESVNKIKLKSEKQAFLTEHFVRKRDLL
jgi:hypothetical protein